MLDGCHYHDLIPTSSRCTLFWYLMTLFLPWVMSLCANCKPTSMARELRALIQTGVPGLMHPSIIQQRELVSTDTTQTFTWLTLLTLLYNRKVTGHNHILHVAEDNTTPHLAMTFRAGAHETDRVDILHTQKLSHNKSS